ncbi:MAG: alpha/beta superfamily hydrolase [Chlamydiales bacterium]|jgi:alpha/beta superfamily hydrolase
MIKRSERIHLVEPGYWLSLVIDQPANSTDKLVILCHGLTGDKVGNQKLLETLSRHLVEKGHAVLRFDFRGSGDSSGLFEDTTFSGMAEDLNNVIHWVQTELAFQHLILAGISIGGVIPMMVYPDHANCRAVLLISSDIIDKPTLSFSGEKKAIRGDDLYLKRAFFEERSHIAPRETLPAKVPVALFYGEKDHKVVVAALELADLGVSPQPIPDSDHLFETEEARNCLAQKMHLFLGNLTSPLV